MVAYVANESIQATIWHDIPDTKEIDTIPWPSGWSIPRLGDRVELMNNVEVVVVQVQWSLPDRVVNIHVEYPDQQLEGEWR